MKDSSKDIIGDSEHHERHQGRKLSDSKIIHEDNREGPPDESCDLEVIKGIEEIYYSEADFDMIAYELNNMPPVIEMSKLDEYRDFLRKQSYAVTRELSRKILKNQAAYVRELERVIDLQSSLLKATSICSKGRSHLSRAKEEATMRVLTVLSKHRRKVLLLNLMKSLRFIKTLQQTDVRLKELLEENNYPTAIQICLECQKAAETFRQYVCIRELSSDLQETLDQIEEQLDVALSKVCNDFNEKQYEKLQSAYMLLGKTQTAMDQLQMHYLNTINNVALQVISDHLTLTNAMPSQHEDLNFSSLCKSMQPEQFYACLIDLCKHFWVVIASYRQAMQWHINFDESLEQKKQDVVVVRSPVTSGSEDDAEKPNGDNKVKHMFDRQYVKSKLDQGLNRIWQDIQQKVKTLVLATDLAYFKYDDFIRVLDVLSRLISIGDEFCNSKSQSLQECIRIQTINYFKAYHRATLDELKMFLENEVWALCPVQTNFGIFSLPEFDFMRPSLALKKSQQHTTSEPKKPDTGFFAAFKSDGKTPFDDLLVTECTKQETEQDRAQDRQKEIERIYGYNDEDDLDDDDDEPDELKLDYVDEKTGDEAESRPMQSTRPNKKISKNSPIISNTTLNVLRSFGKYMQMMSVLKPIAFDVVICMSQLFDYYLFAVYSFFASRWSDATVDVDANSNSGLSSKLTMSLKRISNNIILKKDGVLNQGDLKIPPPSLSPMVDLSNPKDLYGLHHRVVAMESLVFLAKQLKALHSHLDSLIPVNKRAFLSQFFSQTVDVTEELRTPVYKAVADLAIPFDQTIQSMSLVRWDIKEIMSQHSRYVDDLIREFQLLSNSLNSTSSLVPIPEEVNVIIWTHVVYMSNRTFVEGFANVKKCTNEGRALMQLDYQQLLIKLERIAPVRPIPGRELVESFVKAFYLNEQDLERWLKEHPEYSLRQLRNLVTCGTGSHITKKTKNRLLDILEDSERSKSK
ncbi:syndetin-like isoform X2 [Rhopilema esculentum]|uniref:syndetin-like isoform X2 n=1 Tax=Rhopilema esculentum TaxID=499914 RepID=UPI0031E3C65F